jgi:hypothetical protein
MAIEIAPSQYLMGARSELVQKFWPLMTFLLQRETDPAPERDDRNP